MKNEVVLFSGRFGETQIQYTISDTREGGDGRQFRVAITDQTGNVSHTLCETILNAEHAVDDEALKHSNNGAQKGIAIGYPQTIRHPRTFSNS